jgi:hypothetical protein
MITTPNHCANPLFEPKHRWPGAPPICLAENLPAFDTREAAMEFHERNAPGGRVTRIGICSVCGSWHYVSKPRPPSGDSSGSSRR